jgi:hypothetical protein
MSTISHLTLERQLVDVILPLIRLLPELEAQGVDSIPERINLLPQTTTEVYAAYLSWRKGQTHLSSTYKTRVICLQSLTTTSRTTGYRVYYPDASDNSPRHVYNPISSHSHTSLHPALRSTRCITTVHDSPFPDYRPRKYAGPLTPP